MLLCLLVINQLSISAYIKVNPIVIVHFNARPIAKGYNKKTRINYDQTYALIACLNYICVVLAIVVEQYMSQYPTLISKLHSFMVITWFKLKWFCYP